MGKIVFTNGVFDIIHSGHIELFKFAKSLTGTDGKLIVAINSDRAVRELKGPDRPINKEQDRKRVLEAIRYIDEVIIFDEIETLSTILKINPHILVKGGEYTSDQIRQRDNIPKNIEIVVAPILKGYSTTGKLKEIKEKDNIDKKQDNKPFSDKIIRTE